MLGNKIFNVGLVNSMFRGNRKNLVFKSTFSTIASENITSNEGKVDSQPVFTDDVASKVISGTHPAGSNLVFKRSLPFMNPYVPPRQAWVLNMDYVEEDNLSIIDLHPQIFGTQPRIDLIKENVVWQTKYRYVSFAHTKVTAEVSRSGKKPWPQKGTGRARHGTRRSVIWKGGGRCHGPRSPTSHFYMLSLFMRVHGLCSTLTIKLAQDDLFIVKDLEIPTDNEQYLLDLIKSRNWGPSVLFVDVDDIMPKNITIATNNVGHVNLMPVYGLNVYSMLKHDTLVLTLAAVQRLEEKLLMQLHGPSSQLKHIQRFKTNQA